MTRLKSLSELNGRVCSRAWYVHPHTARGLPLVLIMIITLERVPHTLRSSPLRCMHMQARGTISSATFLQNAQMLVKPEEPSLVAAESSGSTATVAGTFCIGFIGLVRLCANKVPHLTHTHTPHTTHHTPHTTHTHTHTNSEPPFRVRVRVRLAYCIDRNTWRVAARSCRR